MEQLFINIPNVVTFLDDILLTGSNKKEHLATMETVLETLQKAGLTVNPKKCEFFKDQIEYVGHVITKEGLKTSQKKVQAIVAAPRPTNVTEIRSFLGMVNFYNKFIPNAAVVLRPIYDLLKGETKFNWSKECEDSFKKIKNILNSDLVLTHFNPDLPLILTCDASTVGISAVLSHRMPDDSEKMIACTSRTLQPSEKNYPVIHLECLAIYWGMIKLYQYLYGKNFLLRTDHKALVSLLSPQKGIPVMHANRLQRWAAYISSFNYKIEHIKGKQNVIADYLSRSPLKTYVISDEYESNGNYLYFTARQDEWPIDNQEIQVNTAKDDILQKITKYIQQGTWPKEINPEIQPYHNRRDQLILEKGIILWGHRVVVPKSLRGRILEELHEHHFGIVKTKSMARSYIYWPSIDKDIEKVCKSCIYCLQNRAAPPKTTLTPWKIENEPWDRVHMDYLDLNGKMVLIMVDAYSKWIEAWVTKTMTSKETEEKVKEACARFGLPKTMVSDNGTQFTASNMQKFFKRNGIRHITSPPGHPQSNGLAENAVKTFKNNVKSRLADPQNKDKTLNMIILEFLFSYRTTKHISTQETPAYLMLNRNIRTRMDILRETANKDTNKHQEEDTPTMQQQQQQKAQERQKKNFGGKERKISIGDKVLVMDYRTVNKRVWTRATIEKKVGKTTYLCRLEQGHLWKRHINQIQLLNHEKHQKVEEKEELEVQKDQQKRTCGGHSNNSNNIVDCFTERPETQQGISHVNNSFPNLDQRVIQAEPPYACSQPTTQPPIQISNPSLEIPTTSKATVSDNNKTEQKQGSVQKQDKNKVVSPQLDRIAELGGKEKQRSNARPKREAKLPPRFSDFVVDID